MFPKTGQDISRPSGKREMIKISGTYLYPYPSEQTEKRERTAINFTYSCPYKYFLYESKSGDRIGNKYYSTKAEAEVALSEYLNSLSPEEFANHTAERMLGT